MDVKHLKLSTPYPGVALVSFSRPPVNAFNREMWREIPVVFNRLSQDDAIRVVILASSQRMFTAGLDLLDTADFNLESSDPSRTAIEFRSSIKEFQIAISSIEECRVPVIAAIHGIAYGLGLDILSACDIRYATSNAIFSIKEVSIGMASDVGSLARFPKTVGNESFTREAALTGRDFTADEALRIGFLSRIVPSAKGKEKEDVLAAALDTAKVIASKSPIAVVGTKALLLHSRDHSVRENLDFTAAWNQVMLQSADVKEAISSFVERRAPQFQSLRGVTQHKL